MSLADMVINQVKSAVKKRLESLDANHDGHPDVPQIFAKIEAFGAAIAPLAVKLKPEDVMAVLKKFNEFLGNRFTDAELMAVEHGLNEFAHALQLLESVGQELAKGV